jgi:hypothetical protein
MVADTEINSVSGISAKILINGELSAPEDFALSLCDILKRYGLQRTQWQGWVFEDSMILLFALLSPTPLEKSMFIKLAKELSDDRGCLWFARGVAPLSAPGTFRYLTEIIP